MILFETSLIAGVVIGLVYALTGASLVVIFRTSGYISFCQGDIAVLSLYAGYFLHYLGLPYLAMAAAVVVVGIFVAFLVGALVAIPLERIGPLSAALGTVGVGLLIQGIETWLIYTRPLSFPAAGAGVLFDIGGVHIAVQDVVSAAVCIAVFCALAIFFQRSHMGVAMRAVNDNAGAANLLGLPARRLKYVGWALSGALAAIAGLFVAPMYGLSPDSVNRLLVFGFATVVLGGFESVLGALICGILVGVSSNLVAAYISSDLVLFGIYGLILVVLLARPSGLFGRRRLERV